jgi:antitoxin ParD1/3/4
MATMTISLPDNMKDWVENFTQEGEYASTSDYVRDLIRKDKEKWFTKLSIDEVKEIIAVSKQSGKSERSIDEIFKQAQMIVASKIGNNL